MVSLMHKIKRALLEQQEMLKENIQKACDNNHIPFHRQKRQVSPARKSLNFINKEKKSTAGAVEVLMRC